MKIWIDHLRGLAAAVEAYEKFQETLDTLPGASDLFGNATVEFNLGGYLPGWFIVREDDAIYVTMKEDSLD